MTHHNSPMGEQEILAVTSKEEQYWESEGGLARLG